MDSDPDVGVAFWAHSKAEQWLWKADVDQDSYKYTKAQLMIATAIVGAELQVSRNYSFTTLQPHIFKLMVAANKKLVGYWQGRLRGLVSFVAEAARANGVTYNGSCVSHSSWGLYHGASDERILQAFQDLRTFQSSLHFVAYKIGAWHVRLDGTLSSMSLGWATNFLFSTIRELQSFAAVSVLEECEDGSLSESEITDSPAAKKSKGDELTTETSDQNL